jgi:hypothetical protein
VTLRIVNVLQVDRVVNIDPLTTARLFGREHLLLASPPRR